MPIARNYKEGSVIYFEGDKSNEIYILKSGKVVLISTEIDTGEERKDEIKTGEFFGIKSVLGKYPREETAQVLTQSIVLVFTQEEFEKLISKNFNILMKLLKVFSNQLRRVGKKVRNLLDKGESRIPATELFNIGEYYFKRGKAEQALYAYKKYMENYPNGQFFQQAQEKINLIESGNMRTDEYSPATEGMDDFSFSPSTDESFPPPITEDDIDDSSIDTPSVSDEKAFDNPLAGLENLGQEIEEQWKTTERKITPQQTQTIQKPATSTQQKPVQQEQFKTKGLDIAKKYYDAFSLLSQEKYNEALAKYDEVINTKDVNDSESLKFVEKSFFEKGKTLIELGKYQEAVSNFTSLIKKFPRSEYIKESLFLIGESYTKLNQLQKAMNFYQKVIGMPPRESINSKAKAKLEELQKKL